MSLLQSASAPTVARAKTPRLPGQTPATGAPPKQPMVRLAPALALLVAVRTTTETAPFGVGVGTPPPLQVPGVPLPLHPTGTSTTIRVFVQ